MLACKNPDLNPHKLKETYNVMWADAQLELGNLLVEEIPSDPRPPEKDRVVFFQRVAMFYVRCLQIFRQLEEVYDQVVHPQKRLSIRATLDSVMGRLCELKNEMVEKEFSEYHYMDDILHDLKLQPSVLEIPIPRFFLTECSEEVQQQKTMLTDIFTMVQVTEPQQPQTVKALHPVEAVRIIQAAERARQGRLRAKLNQESRKMNRMFKTKEYGPEDMEAAAKCIQKVWRDYVQRKKAKVDLEEEMFFLGMAMDPKLQVQSPAEITAKSTEVRTRIKQQEHKNDYQKSISDIKKQLQDLESHDIGNTMKEQIRQWFIECRDATGTFPDYPPEDEGGSALIFAEKNLEQLVEELAAKEEEEANKPKDKKDKDKKDKEANKKAGKKDKGKADEEEEEGLTMLPSAFLSELQMQYRIFEDYWENCSETDNFAQRHEVELIKEEQRKVIEEEIRKEVDEEMNQELAALKVAVDKDKGGKAKGNAKKKSKSGKKKKEKDLTANRTLESLCQELVEQGLMKKPNNVTIKDYLGDFGYLGTTLRQYDIEPMPSLSDVRQVVTLFAILPLGSQVVHEKAPLIKAILLAGPAGVGKKMLVHAICHETGATLFDLSPLNIAGKYPGKSSLAMMLHMVFKVAKLMQPSVIWIGEAEKMFYKKVPKEEKELDPKRLKKDLPKSLKLIKGEDRVMIVGTTRNPQNADIKSMCKMYNKILLIPRPDHGSRYILWKQLLTNQGAEVTKALDLSSLAKISDGYTAGHIVQVVQKVVTRRRILQQPNRPLTAAEFIPHLAKIEPVFQEEEAALKAWYAKTPLGKKRANLAAGTDEEADKKGKEAKKGKGKK